ncbi:hypothetical protein CC80DRAFT_506456 [Byssothecium circinans]|uniref:Uncharacterized protein n=1 Tax=Byssothecium circinans TaxID=147558 RepID=A0A6A5TQC2_9PLEO|nr:hypothetical protein CC80DRAFT_506456 [Byssothecium circinans]
MEKNNDSTAAHIGGGDPAVDDVPQIRNAVGEVAVLHDDLHKHVGTLNDRVRGLEQGQQEMKERIDNLESPQRTTEPKTPAERKRPKGLSISVPKHKSSLKAIDGLPTSAIPVYLLYYVWRLTCCQIFTGSSMNMSEPSAIFSAVPATPATGGPSSAFANLALTPNTPNTPHSPTPMSNRPKSKTSFNKKPTNDLSQKMPPAMVQMPLVPLTDKEILVFFFNSVSRPIVATRIYGRQWGPAKISAVVNEHRTILPYGYSRNTCSVKFTTAIKLGRKQHGEGFEEWEENTRAFFYNVTDDAVATDAIRLAEEEMDQEEDFNVLELVHDLKKYPVEEDGEQGLFTKCVQYCVENEVDIKLSQIHLLAIAIWNGYHPSTALEKRPGAVDQNEAEQGQEEPQ